MGRLAKAVARVAKDPDAVQLDAVQLDAVVRVRKFVVRRFRSNSQLRPLHDHGRVRFDGVGEPNAGANHGALSHHRATAQDRRVGVDDYVIFDRGMAFRVAHQIAVWIGGKT